MDYACEYAKSSRSSCKLCRAAINQGNLRLAIFVQSPLFDGKIPNWYHYTCFFKKATPLDTTSIKGFDAIRYDDQLKIKSRLGLVDTATSGLLLNASSVSVDMFTVEYAKSARSKCKKCEQKIENASVKIVVKGRNSKLDGSYHVDCFVLGQKELEFDFDVNDMPGFDDIEKKDQEIVSKAIGTRPSDKKRKLDSDEAVEEAIKNDPDLSPEAKRIKIEEIQKEKELKAQSQEFWKLRDKLDKELPNDVIKQLIEANGQQIKLTGRDDLLTFLCDCMYFGPLEPCKECPNGQLVYRGFAYCCTGNVTSWTSCRFKTQSPLRKSQLSIDADLLADYTCLRQFKYTPRVRIFANKLEDRVKKSDETTSTSEIKQQQPKLPLFHLNFSSSGKLSRNGAQIKLIIEKLGGKFNSAIDSCTVAVISNPDEVKKQNKNMKYCRANGIHVVSEDILNELIGDSLNIEQLVLKHKISEWGVDSEVKKRMDSSVQAHEMQEKSKEDKYSLKATGFDKIKVSLKGGAAVDPASDLVEGHHVLLDSSSSDKEPFSCVLGLVDIIRGTNSFYKLQIIESDANNRWYLFRSWGRVGTTIGGNKLEKCSSAPEAIAEFKSLYQEKTGNCWTARKTASKVPNKFFPLEIDYGDDQNNEDELGSKLTDESRVSKSKLAKPIQEVVKLIFDIKKMKEQMKEFELDLNKMPLGKISSNQIKNAFSVLNEISQLISKGDSSETLYIDASNRFYTLIPHDFGLKSPPIIKDTTLIKEKTDMLNSLLDMEIAYNILKGDGASGDEEDPIDVHYKRLDCAMEVLDKSSDEFKRIVEYVANTHAQTHASYSLEVVDVFKVKRGNEEERYAKYKSSLHNKKLLWHGSRLTNFAGILSQGLRIAPPEAPVSGYMFGKGIYFADMVSKSANYCFTSKQNPTALMLLCEVALGDMYERFRSEYVTKLPDGKHSTKGCGRTMPDPAGSYFTPDGVEIPMGKGRGATNGASVLLYNEFIVYDTAQVAMRYLLRVHFKHLF